MQTIRRLPTAVWTRPLTACLCAVVLSFLATVPALAQTAAAPIEVPEKILRYRVDCLQDDSSAIQRILDRSPRNQAVVVELSGTCEGRVLIARDDVTLRGIGEAPGIFGGQIAVHGASRIHLESLTVRSVPSDDLIFDREGDGIRLRGANYVQIRDVAVVNAGTRGISIETSSADLTNVTITGTRGIAFMALDSAGVTLSGLNQFTDSGLNGLCSVNGSGVFLNPGSRVELDRNLFGALIDAQGALMLADGSALFARNNRQHGIVAAAQGSINLAATTVEAIDNGGVGIFVLDHANLTPFIVPVPPRMVVTGNRTGGLVVVRNAEAVISPGAIIADNIGPGVLVDEATVWLNGSSVQDNLGGDVQALFGARLTLGEGNLFGTLPECSQSALVRGGDCNTTADAEDGAARLKELRSLINSVRSAPSR